MTLMVDAIREEKDIHEWTWRVYSGTQDESVGVGSEYENVFPRQVGQEELQPPLKISLESEFP